MTIRDEIASDRRELVKNARAWLGTPWKHNQACKGVGVDCIQLGRVVCESVGIEPFVYENYAQTPIKDELLKTFDNHPNFKRSDRILAGNILIFRVSGIPHHVGIATGNDTMIHVDLRHGVVEVNLGYWRSRIVGIFNITCSSELIT